MSKQDLLRRLAALDLSKYPVKEIHTLIQGLGQYGMMITTFHAGKRILRARPNFGGEEFSAAKDLSYKPANLNETYQRASTPQRTMFYGSMFPEGNSGRDLNMARVIGVLEASNLIRDKTIFEGEQVMTFGKWRVTKDITVCSIVHHNAFLSKNRMVKFQKDEYDNSLKSYPEIAEDSSLICQFFADEFAKENTLHDYDYLISAIYSDRVTRLSVEGNMIAGVIYPSVRTEGEGLNIAITPWHANNCLELEAVIQGTLYKKGRHVVLGNEKVAVLKPGEKEFNLVPITDPKELVDRGVALKLLNKQIAEETLI